jgi:hypothetical protein
MDCHVIVTGCPVCHAVLETAGGIGNNLKNDDLVAHLTDAAVLTTHEIFTTDDPLGYALGLLKGGK